MTTTRDYLVCPGPSSKFRFYDESYGKWMIFRNFEDLYDSWYSIQAALRSGRLQATGIMCSTLKYNPLFGGAGPKTVGVVTVYTKENDTMEVGLQLIKLPVVQHDIQYKTQKASKAMIYEHTTPKDQKLAECTLYWNNGNPSSELTGTKCPSKDRNDRHSYDPASDRWKINIVLGAPHYMSDRPHGKWVLVSNYNKSSEVNVYNLWHTLKPRVEKGRIPAIQMECPAQKLGELPQIHIYTSEFYMNEVGEKVIPAVKSDITYELNRKSFKILCWNHGNPCYK